MRALVFAACIVVLSGSAWAQDVNPPVIGKVTPPSTQPQFNQYSNDTDKVSRLDVDRAIASVLLQNGVRFDAIEKAIQLAHEDSVRVPTIVDRAINGVQALFDSKLAVISSEAATKREELSGKLEEVSGKLSVLAIQFQERTAASSTAIAAALQAAKEAVGEQNKSSASAIEKAQTQTTEQLAQLRTLASSEISAQTAQITDLKSRLDKSEGPLAISQNTIASMQAQLIDTKSRLDRIEGNKGGTDQTVTWIFGIIATGAGIIAIIGFFQRGHIANNYYHPNNDTRQV
jgi:hypothetical protein